MSINEACLKDLNMLCSPSSFEIWEFSVTKELKLRCIEPYIKNEACFQTS